MRISKEFINTKKSVRASEGVVLGDADEQIARDIDLIMQNEERLQKQMESLVTSLAKKSIKGIGLDKEKLAKSSVMDSLIRDAIRWLQKEDSETFSRISTATRNLAKQKVAETILSAVEDHIDWLNRESRKESKVVREERDWNDPNSWPYIRKYPKLVEFGENLGEKKLELLNNAILSITQAMEDLESDKSVYDLRNFKYLLSHANELTKCWNALKRNGNW